MIEFIDSKVPKSHPLAHIDINTPSTTPAILIIEKNDIIMFIVLIKSTINAREIEIKIP